MTPRTVSDRILREAPLLRADQTVEAATRELLVAELPALPVVDSGGRFAGIFGERELMAAVFPGYLKELKSATRSTTPWSATRPAGASRCRAT